MCLSGKWIYNKFIKKSLFVDCGKCPACLQKKAEHRTARINYNCYPNQTCLFVNLDYAPDCVPYVHYKDLLNKEQNLSVYRFTDRRRVFVKDRLQLHQYNEVQLLDTYDFSLTPEAYDGIEKQEFCFLHNHPVPDCVGVIYYPDIQNFIKNLRQYLIRRFNFTDSFSFFICSEYGETYQRPHFHLLIWCPVGFEHIFRHSICNAWRFNNNNRTRRNIKTGWKVAKYVSSYVNCTSIIPPFLSRYCFRPKHSYSKGFGLALRDFTPLEIEKKVDRRNLTFDRVFILDGVPRTINSVLPRYVINRYFPKFKGYSRLTDIEIYDIICCPQKLCSLRKRIEYSGDEIKAISVALNNAFKRYKSYFCSLNNEKIGFSREEYAFRFVRTWSCYNSCIYRKFIENIDYTDPVDVLESYDNIVDVYSGDVDAPTLQNFIDSVSAENLRSDPNTFIKRLVSSQRLDSDFYTYQKKRKINDLIYSNSYESCIA